MYKALLTSPETEIVLLEPRWRARMTELREMGNSGAVVCPGCREEVRVRAGKFRRWHFAHHHLQNCPLSRQSPELLTARAELYAWLVRQFEPGQVTVEKNIPDLPRPVDIWVETERGGFAYWIFDARLTPQIRQTLRAGLEGKGNTTNWIFSSSLLNEETQFPGHLNLTTTEREFMRTSTLDAYAEAAGEAAACTLHYLDAQTGQVFTFRRLRLKHPPQRYSGQRLQHRLNEIQILPETGEFLHPGEVERLRKFSFKAEAARDRLQRQDQFTKSIQSRRSDAAPTSARQTETSPGSASRPELSLTASQRLISPSLRQAFTRSGICLHCGKETTDWVTYIGKTGTCVCRECYKMTTKSDN